MSRKVYSLRLDESLIESLREKADKLGITLTELANRYLSKGIEEDSFLKRSSAENNSEKSSEANPSELMVSQLVKCILDNKSTSVELEVKKLRSDLKSLENHLSEMQAKIGK